MAGDFLKPSDIESTCKFLHDRVQQAAYYLVPDEDKKRLHLLIGYHMIAEMDKDDSIFSIVNHMNAGSELIAEPEEKQKLVHLNLAAGNKAAAASVYEPALKYYHQAMNFTTGNSWEEDYDKTFELYRECSNCEYLCGNFDKAEQLFETVLKYAKSSLERAAIQNILITQYANQVKFPEAVRVGLEALKALDPDFPVEEEEWEKANPGSIGQSLRRPNRQRSDSRSSVSRMPA